MGEDVNDDVTRRSKAWVLGWLAVSGPAAAVISVALMPVLQTVNVYYATALLQLWVIVGVILGVAAVVTGNRDQKQNLRYAWPGVLVGAAGTFFCVAELAAVVYILNALSQL